MPTECTFILPPPLPAVQRWRRHMRTRFIRSLSPSRFNSGQTHFISKRECLSRYCATKVPVSCSAPPVSPLHNTHSPSFSLLLRQNLTLDTFVDSMRRATQQQRQPRRRGLRRTGRAAPQPLRARLKGDHGGPRASARVMPKPN